MICGSSTPSFLQYQWCVNLVQSRACYIDGFDMFNGKRSCACYALVPVYDLANHYELPGMAYSVPPWTTCVGVTHSCLGTSRAAVFEYDRQRQAFRMTTNWSYQPMQEVLHHSISGLIDTASHKGLELLWIWARSWLLNAIRVCNLPADFSVCWSL